MSIEIIIKADDLAAAIGKLADAIRLRANVATVDGSALTIPAGTPLTVTEVTPVEPEKQEKPKRTRKAAKAPESTQEPAGEPEAPQDVTTPAEPEKPAEVPWETVADSPAAAVFAAENKPVPTMEQIATAGARLLDNNPNAMDQLIALLGEYGVQAITQLKADQLAGFADRLRALGAEV